MGEISVADEARLRDHLERCAHCRAVRSDSRRALALYDEHAVPHPPENYWPEFVMRLLAKVGAEDTAGMGPPVAERVRLALRQVPLRIAAAILLFALGIVVGRATVDRIEPDASTSATVGDEAVNQVLTRALTLFLNLSKADPPIAEAAVSSAQVQAAEILLRDTRMLQFVFEDTDDVMLSSLIDDVELVLLQYTNAGTRNQALSALEELGLLLRINLYMIDRNRVDDAVHL